MRRKLHDETQSNETIHPFLITEPTTNVVDFSSTLKELRKNVDPQLVRQRAGRRDENGQVHMVEYVEWHTVADILDEHAPNWEHTVKDIRSIGDIAIVTVAITINGVTREGIGTGRAVSETGIKKAEHDALKRAAVKFGIARDLYKKEHETVGNDERSQPNPLSVEDPVAKTLGDMVTSKQLGMIRATARDAQLDADQECALLFNCSVSELSKKAASEFIDHLQALQRRSAMPMRRAG
jgi:hypothetical protein